MDDIVDVNTLFGPLPAASADLAVDVLLELMQKHEVRSACTLSTLGVLLDPAVGNAATRAACSEHPELVPVATLNPTMFFGDPEPLQRLGSDGFKMLRFFPRLQNWRIDFAPFHALLDGIKDTGMPVMVRADSVGEITDLIRELGSYNGAVILSNVDMSSLAEAIAALRMFPNWHVEISRLLSPGCLKLIVDTLGSDRLLFGTGAPAQPVASALHTLQYAGLDEVTRKKILGANARRVLKLAG